MGGGETSLGGLGPRGFPDTTWGMVSRLKDSADDIQREGLEALSRRYWKPVYHYVRFAWAKDNDAAKDLTQAFFLWLVEEGALKAYSSGQSGFRTFLKLLLNRFVSNREKALHRLKRGGGVRLLSLDDADHPIEDPPAAAGNDPERAFDEAWIVEVVDQALDRVRATSAADAEALGVYEAYDLAPREERPTYAEIAERVGIPERTVKLHLLTMRKRVRAAIREELARLTLDGQALEEEWNALFGPGGPGPSRA